MSKTVTLVNRTKRPRRMLVLNLTKAVAPVSITNRTTEESRQGDRRTRVSRKLVPDSLRIRHGGSETVPATYLDAPEVKAAIKAGDLAVKKSPTADEKKAADSQAARSKAWAKKKAAAKADPKKAPAPAGEPKTRRNKNA